LPKPLSNRAKSLPFSMPICKNGVIEEDTEESPRTEAGLISMMQKKKTRQVQETQELSPGEFSGREPMTGAQETFLKTLAEESREPAAYQQGLSQREASRRIDALMERLRLGALPPHTD
jgi:hypothetical protein